MIYLARKIFDDIIAHAKADLPNEACGYLAGKENIVTKGYRLTNIDHSPEHFSFDPAEQFATLKDARNNGFQLIANYHSHPTTPARPSLEDIKLAYDPEIHYLIISLAADEPVLKSFLIRNGEVETEEIKIVDLFQKPSS